MSTVQGYENLQRRFAALRGQGSVTLMGELGGRVIQEAKAIVPRKTGNLARSIHIVSKSATSVRVEAGANYAAYVEFGTRPHIITPQAKKALAFASQGIVNERFGTQKSIFRLSGSLTSGAMRRFGNAAFVVVKSVHHPGTRAEPYLIPAAKNAVSKVGADVVVKIWNEAA